MSSVDVPIVRPTTEAAPKDYEIPAAQEIAPLAVRAFIDGTGAGGTFTPALQLIAPGGEVMWTATTSDTVAAGASADVSWFPRVGGGAAAAASGIQFDVANQTGGFLDAFTTTGSITMEDHSGAGFYIDSEDPGGLTGGFIALTTADGEVIIDSDSIVLRTTNEVQIQDGSGNIRGRFGEDGSSEQTLTAGTVHNIRNHLGQRVFRVHEDGNIDAPRLPTVNPGVSGALWNNAGVVNVSP